MVKVFLSICRSQTILLPLFQQWFSSSPLWCVPGLFWCSEWVEEVLACICRSCLADAIVWSQVTYLKQLCNLRRWSSHWPPGRWTPLYWFELPFQHSGESCAEAHSLTETLPVILLREDYISKILPSTSAVPTLSTILSSLPPTYPLVAKRCSRWGWCVAAPVAMGSSLNLQLTNSSAVLVGSCQFIITLYKLPGSVGMLGLMGVFKQKSSHVACPCLTGILLPAYIWDDLEPKRAR